LGVPLGIFQSEVRGGFARLDRGEGGKVECEGKDGKKEDGFHESNIPWNVGGSRIGFLDHHDSFGE
jgi:hypothetical protein